MLVPLVERGAGCRLVLTRRAALLRHHPGQVAFPGGKQDPEDATPLAAALREAEEEIGLESADDPRGAADPRDGDRFRRDALRGADRAGFVPRIDRAEVDEVFEVPLGYVTDPANFRIEGRLGRGSSATTTSCPWGPHYIWGATARMLRMLADRMHPA